MKGFNGRYRRWLGNQMAAYAGCGGWLADILAEHPQRRRRRLRVAVAGLRLICGTPLAASCTN